MYIQDRPQQAVQQAARHWATRMTQRWLTITAALLLVACSDSKTAAPPAPTWTIGGTVAGLTGSGLLLRNNGVGSLPVLANGSFVFATALADGAAYDVDVLAQPGLPPERCTVSNGAGTVAAANVTNIAITCIPKPNDAPVAVNDPLVAIAVTGVPVDIPTATLLANDTDVDIDLGIDQTLSVTGVSSLVGGTVSLSLDGNTVTFTSDPAFTGTASFEYTLSDGAGGTDVGLVTVRVNAPDVTAPTVASTTTTPPGLVTTTPAVPPDTAAVTVVTAVPVTAALVVAFSEAMDATTLLTDDAVIAPGAFTLTTGSPAAAVPGAVTAANNGYTFTPTSPLATNTAYDLTISTAATDTSGNALAAAYTWPFTTSHWGKADALTAAADNTDGASSPQIAVDAAGNALAVWAQSDGVRYNIWARDYTAATKTWNATPVLIEADNIGSADAPDVAFDAAGNALVVWQQWDGQRISIWANRYAGGVWNGAALIETDNAGNALSPRIAFDADGNALAVWRQHDGTRYNIWANRYAGGVWNGAALIETDDAGDAYYPRVAFDGSGNAFAVWQQYDGTRYNIWVNRYTFGVGWGVAALIEIEDGPATAPKSAHVPRLAVESDGDATVVWFQSDGVRRANIWANRYDVVSGWGGAVLIENEDAGDATYPEVAVNASGNTTVVWSQSDGSRTGIWANEYGTGWGMPVLVETASTGNAYAPQVVVAANGDAVAVWLQSDGTRYNVRTSHHVAGAPAWGATESIEFGAGTAATPDIAINAADDHVFAVWRQFDGTRDNIWANDRDP